MPSMFGRNKWIPKDAPFHHGLTPFLSVVSKIIYTELMVRLSFLLSSVLTNCNLGHRIAQVRVVFEIPSRAVREHQIFHSSMALPTHLAYIEWFSPLSASPSVAAAKIDVFAKNGYNKCNKFRTIMKIIT